MDGGSQGSGDERRSSEEGCGGAVFTEHDGTLYTVALNLGSSGSVKERLQQTDNQAIFTPM